MRNRDLKVRTKAFALDIIRFTESLPRNRTAEVIGRQLLRCGTSVGANYRAACRSRSQADFIAKMGIVEEEADECLYWMDLLIESRIVERELASKLMSEADELVSIVVASIKTARNGSR
jgi:four helix bundle protein